MKKQILKSIALLVVALSFASCTKNAEGKFKIPFLNKSSNTNTTIMSNDKSIKADLIGTWIGKDGRETDTFIFNKDGTFEYNTNYSYGGAERLSVGPGGSLTTRVGFDSKGTFKIIDGNILQCNFKSVARYGRFETDIAEGMTGTSELRVISKNEVLMNGKIMLTRQ